MREKSIGSEGDCTREVRMKKMNGERVIILRMKKFTENRKGQRRNVNDGENAYWIIMIMIVHYSRHIVMLLSLLSLLSLLMDLSSYLPKIILEDLIEYTHIPFFNKFCTNLFIISLHSSIHPFNQSS